MVTPLSPMTEQLVAVAHETEYAAALLKAVMGLAEDHVPLREVIDPPETLTAMQNRAAVQETEIRPVGPVVRFAVHFVPSKVRI